MTEQISRFMVTVIMTVFFIAGVIIILLMSSLTHDSHQTIKGQLATITQVDKVIHIQERCGVIVFTNIIMAGDSPDMPICLLINEEGEMFLWNGADDTVFMNITFKREIDIPFN